MTERQIKPGQYLFDRHGGAVVSCGRFLSVLHALAALIAGANCMRWPRFLFFNAAGGIDWAAVYGIGAYFHLQVIPMSAVSDVAFETYPDLFKYGASNAIPYGHGLGDNCQGAPAGMMGAAGHEATGVSAVRRAVSAASTRSRITEHWIADSAKERFPPRSFG